MLVHGIFGTNKELAPLAAALRGTRYQVHELEYSDFRRKVTRSGADFAEELAALRARLGDGKPLTILAHSMGGLVTRAALNAMAASGEISRWGRVRAICVDTPWHGASGPGGEMMLPGAFDEMRARSPLFQQLRKPLADNVEIELLFAQEGSIALDYTEAPLSELPAKIARFYSADEPVRGEPKILNFWHALIWSSRYTAFHAELEQKASKGPLDAAAVKAALLKHYPRFPGGHTTVLEVRGPASLAAHLAAALLP